jgi:triosephosphate isomerase
LAAFPLYFREGFSMRMLLAGNWKMNGLRAALGEIRALKRGLNGTPPRADILICPPATLIAEAAKAAEDSPIAIGGQDCHVQPSGAFTGDISAEMLRDAGATAVIVGHSERRQYHGETDAAVAAKARAAKRAGLLDIICVGESEKERNAGHAVEVVSRQLTGGIPPDIEPGDLAIAYEPVWAIGTGRTPAAAQIGDMHEAIRANLRARLGAAAETIRILYGGSVKPDNAAEILAVPNVDGALVGGASLKSGDFLAIIGAAPKR